MHGSSSWMPYAPQGVKGFDDDDELTQQWAVLKNNIKMYIKIYIKIAPTCFGVTVTPSSGSALIRAY